MMLNPCYLIKSRHSIYYFRYPLPVDQRGVSSRVSVSLRTRCPKQALRLANALEYHSIGLIERLDLTRMDHSEIVAMFKEYYAEVLERCKASIDRDGAYPPEKVDRITQEIADLDELIKDGCDDIFDQCTSDYIPPEERLFYKEIMALMDKHNLSFGVDSKEYSDMKAYWKCTSSEYVGQSCLKA